MDYIQRPVDEAYRAGIERMGSQGPPLRGLDWLDAIAHMLGTGLVMRGGMGSPMSKAKHYADLTPDQRTSILQDIRRAMNMLLRGNAPTKEPDPRIASQFGRARGYQSAIEEGASRSRIKDWITSGSPRDPYWDRFARVEKVPGPNVIVQSSPGSIELPGLSIKTDYFPKGNRYRDWYREIDALEGMNLWP